MLHIPETVVVDGNLVRAPAPHTLVIGDLGIHGNNPETVVVDGNLVRARKRRALYSPSHVHQGFQPWGYCGPAPGEHLMQVQYKRLRPHGLQSAQIPQCTLTQARHWMPGVFWHSAVTGNVRPAQ